VRKASVPSAEPMPIAMALRTFTSRRCYGVINLACVGGEIDTVRSIADSVDGFLFPHEGPLLYELARACTGRGVIVEIGSFKGKSTIWLASGSKAGAGVRVYAVDPHTGCPDLYEQYGDQIWTLPEFKENVERAGVADVVSPIVATSEDAAREFSDPVELLFVDAEHAVDFVRADLAAWMPKVLEDGVVALHDTGRGQQPLVVAAETLYAGRGFRDVRFVDTITYARKTSRSRVYDRVRGRFVLRLKLAATVLRELNLPAPVRAVGRVVLGRFR
jgi:predicted O-methyltransferase YrrM